MSGQITLNEAMEIYGLPRPALRTLINRFKITRYTDGEKVTYNKDKFDHAVKFYVPGEDLIDRNSVDWDNGRCRGFNPEFFFLEDSQLVEKYIDNQTVRRICFGCPIRKECMEVGFAYEDWGTWGGLTYWERAQIKNGRHDVRQLGALKNDLQKFGITLAEALGGWHERIINA